GGADRSEVRPLVGHAALPAVLGLRVAGPARPRFAAAARRALTRTAELRNAWRDRRLRSPRREPPRSAPLLSPRAGAQPARSRSAATLADPPASARWRASRRSIAVLSCAAHSC